jgi:hypothetical protein
MIGTEGGGPLNTHAPPDDGTYGTAVLATKPAALIVQFGPKKKPLWFINTTVPLALRLPQICDGLRSLIWFQTTDEAEGWMNVVVSPAPMLKLCQLMKALCEAVMLSCDPFCDALTAPLPTVMPCGFPSAGEMRSAASNVKTRRETAMAPAAFERIPDLFFALLTVTGSTQRLFR